MFFERQFGFMQYRFVFMEDYFELSGFSQQLFKTNFDNLKVKFGYLQNRINNIEMININLNRIFKARGIEQPYRFLVQNGFVSFTAHKYKNGKVEQMRLDHIERLCILLNCTPNDVFEWVPNDLLDDRPDHPLQQIRRRDKKLQISQLLSKMPLHKLEEVERMLQSV